MVADGACQYSEFIALQGRDNWLSLRSTFLFNNEAWQPLPGDRNFVQIAGCDRP